MATKPADSVEDLRAELDALRSDIASLVDTVKDIGRESADSALHSAREAMDKATGRIKVSAHEARERGEAAADEVEAMITRHPVGSVLLAVGIGYLVGRIRG